MVDVNDFFGVIIRPDEVLPKSVRKASVKDADRTYAIYGGLIGLVIGLVIAAVASLGSLSSSVSGMQFFTALFAGLGVLAIIVLPIVGAILSVIFSRIGAWIISKISNWFGGKDNFEAQYYLQSTLIWPTFVVGILVNILMAVPVIGWLISIVWALYSIYLGICVISVANKTTKVGGLLSMIVFIIVVGVIALLIAMVTGITIASMLGATAPVY